MPTPPPANAAIETPAAPRPGPDSAPNITWAPPIDGHGLFKSLMLRLPRSVRRSLDHEQLMAIRQAAEEMAWGEHPIDIRLSLPFPGVRRYVVLLAGKERRDPERRRQERLRHPLVRAGNLVSLVIFLLILAGLGALVGLAILAVTPA